MSVGDLTAAARSTVAPGDATEMDMRKGSRTPSSSAWARVASVSRPDGPACMVKTAGDGIRP